MEIGYFQKFGRSENNQISLLWAAGYKSIVLIDPNLGSGRLWGSMGDYQVAGDLTWDVNDVLLMITTSGELLHLDPNERSLEVIGPLPDTDMYALARSREKILYGLNSSGQLFTVDPNSGERTLLGPLDCDFDLAEPWGAAFPDEAIRVSNEPNAMMPVEPNRL